MLLWLAEYDSYSEKGIKTPFAALMTVIWIKSPDFNSGDADLISV